MRMTSSPDAQKTNLKVFELGNGRKTTVAALFRLLPDVETALFFAKLYRLDYRKLSELITLLFADTNPVVAALTEGDHSTELQQYIVDTVPASVVKQAKPTFVVKPPPPQFLPLLWEANEIEVASSIAAVADKLLKVLDLLPGKQGEVGFAHLRKLNKARPTIGTYEARIHHPQVVENLVILDDSGSVNRTTVHKIIGDVVGLTWKANAHLALVSNTTRHWEPGSFGVDDVLRVAQYGGTQYETLTELLNSRDWGTVVTIADYDSARDAKTWLSRHVTKKIGQVLDISLVGKPTYLAECVGQFADEVRPLLIGNSSYVLS